MNRRLFLAGFASTAMMPCSLAGPDDDLIKSITKETVWRNRDGKNRTWFHPRTCMVPNGKGGGTALMTVQEIGGSDYFGPVHWSESSDLGRHWRKPEPIRSLGRIPEPKHPGMVAGVRCAFDGEELQIRQVGPPLELKHGRGLLEPSVTQYHGKFHITIRAEDGHGYHSTSQDGLNWAPKQKWMCDDGSAVPMSTTQQHWLTHSDGLFLVYTRKDESNTGVIRWRSPLWLARVDDKTGRLIRSTERIVLSLVGDGVKAPDSVALMGNFHVTNASADESWVTVGEWMPHHGARGDLLLARIRWANKNRLVAGEAGGTGGKFRKGG